MERMDIIREAWEAQSDAGSLAHFYEQVCKVRDSSTDAVAAFMSSILKSDTPVGDIIFYGSEIEKIVNRFKQIQDEEEN